MTLPQQTSQQQSQHFLLKWNNHRSNMVNVFESLLTAENLVDVTIAVEGKFLKAHKIVLSACSPYFQAMFVNHSPSDRYPILLFHDIKFAHLKTLLDFMYRGEISIDEKDLGDVLKVAEALSIRGLSSFESDDEEGDAKPEGGGGGGQQQQQPGQQGGSSSSGNNGTENSVTNSSQEFDGGGGKNNASSPISNPPPPPSDINNAATPSNSSPTSHKSNRKQKGTKTKNKLVTSKRHHHHHHESPAGGSCDASTMAKMTIGGGAKEKGVKGPRIKCETETSQTTQAAQTVLATMEAAAGVVLPVKKKRGRAKKVVVDAIPTTKLTPRPTTTPHTYAASTKSPSSKFHPIPLAGSKASILPPRHSVRRRIPRRYPGLQTRLKRVKLSKQDYANDEDRAAAANNGNAGPNQYEEMDDALLQQMLEGEESQCLNEMSVRGLDLFKYASVEDNVYRCIECEKLRIPKTFKNKYSFQRHAFLYHEGNMRKVFPCPVCSREFSRPDKMKNHMRSVHEGCVTGNGKESKTENGSTSSSAKDVSTKMELDDDEEDGTLNQNDESSCDS